MNSNLPCADAHNQMSLLLFDCLRRTAVTLLLICIFGFEGDRASAQVVESATRGRTSVYAGAAASGYYLGYGKRNMVGISGFVDTDSHTGIGIELEGRWLEYHESANVHSETFMIGPRYHFSLGRLQPYAKLLVGSGYFNFPYNYAKGHYFVVSPGGGLDYGIRQRVSLRVDMEYQRWTDFTFGPMESAGVSAGIRYRLF
jgi:hypothetical protein